MKKTLTRNEIDWIVDTCTSYADGERQVMTELELEIDEIEEIMLNENHERCNVCQWWFPAYEFVDEDNNQRESCNECQQG